MDRRKTNETLRNAATRSTAVFIASLAVVSACSSVAEGDQSRPEHNLVVTEAPTPAPESTPGLIKDSTDITAPEPQTSTTFAEENRSTPEDNSKPTVVEFTAALATNQENMLSNITGDFYKNRDHIAETIEKFIDTAAPGSENLLDPEAYRRMWNGVIVTETQGIDRSYFIVMNNPIVFEDPLNNRLFFAAPVPGTNRFLSIILGSQNEETGAYEHEGRDYDNSQFSAQPEKPFSGAFTIVSPSSLNEGVLTSYDEVAYRLGRGHQEVTTIGGVFASKEKALSFLGKPIDFGENPEILIASIKEALSK